MIKKIIRQIGLVLIALSVLTGMGGGAEDSIYKITILGNAKTEEAVILGAIKSQEGAPFSIDQVREDLRSIFNLGFFTDVQVDVQTRPQGKEVIFIVVEKPSIKEVLIKGNAKVKKEEIKDKITVTTHSILNLDKVKESLEQVRKLYFSKGYYGVKVEYRVDSLEGNEATVTFTIVEGPKGHIQKIVFKGNKAIRSSRLKKLMITKEWGIFSFLTKSGTLDEDALKNDIQLLTAYYYDNGYLEAKLSEPKIDLTKPKKIRIEIEVTEGPRYHFSDINFKGDVPANTEELSKLLTIKRGDIYSNTAIHKDINTLTEHFANQGYAYAEINPDSSIDKNNLLVSLMLEVDKKQQVYYERIQVVGNTKTRDKVVRRELRVTEGELYNASAMNKSRDRLKRTGFFKEVEFLSNRGSAEDKSNLDVKVEESPTGSLSFGVGYSTVESVVGTVSISDRNLFGLGYNGSVKLSMGGQTQNFALSFTDPYFLESSYSAGIDLYHEANETFSTYSYKIAGASLRFGKELSDVFRVDARYKLESNDVYNVTGDTLFDATGQPIVYFDTGISNPYPPPATFLIYKTFYPSYLLAQLGRSTTSAISFTPSIDSRDDYYNPTKGGVHYLTIQNTGGVLGGDNKYLKVEAGTSWFFPLPWDTVLNLRAKGGIISGSKIPIYDKFYLGGLSTVRGFDYGKGGPVDPITGEAVGADKMVVFNVEWIFPLAREIGLKGALFFDVGQAWGPKPSTLSKVVQTGEVIDLADATKYLYNPTHHKGGIKLGAGPGIRWQSPFGPIHIDIGFNLRPGPGESGSKFEFTAGSTF